VALKEALEPEFKKYQQKILANAKTLAEELGRRGLRIVSGGTDNHLLLVDLTKLDLSGKEAAIMLDAARITVNKNLIPFDKRSPFQTSGLRLGTPAVTTRGMGPVQMREIAGIIADVVAAKGEEGAVTRAVRRVDVLTKKFPLYQPLLKKFKGGLR
jgi:glycine hydroxymethyltransferase